MRIFFFLVVVFVFISCSKFQKLQKSDDLDAKLNGAIQYYESGDYYRSGILLQDILPLVKGRAEAERALFYMANIYYKQKEYVMSAYYFEEFTQTYPRSIYAEEAAYLRVRSLFLDSPAYNLDQSNTEQALKSVQDFFAKYPYSKYNDELITISDELNEKLIKKEFENAKQYYKTNRLKSATVALRNFIEAFPQSAYIEEAYFLQFHAQYLYAKNTVKGHKQLERYYEAINFYSIFAEKFPTSKFNEQAKKAYDFCQKQIQLYNK
ncbi:MAG: outer membrane protein assembly factor BamD [Cytophagaceae bacterium]|nr:outer membrane protein assembly factor BamD [Cytophagaceae bacterium]MDW8457342.1 outer membrane protein assembly factor BamD [Cytophagaceae bacterium]